MKKLTLLVLIIALCMIFTGCFSENPDTDNTVHTLPPTEEASSVEPEWAEVNCDISLVQSTTNNVILYSDDFDTFAVYGTNDDDSYIELKVSSQAVDIINSTADLSDLQLVINGEAKADIVIKPGAFTGEIAFGHDMPYENLCQLASNIRGLY